jgi:uncharacterized membrane protein HdeD (DUF308 family)
MSHTLKWVLAWAAIALFIMGIYLLCTPAVLTQASTNSKKS